MKTKVQSSKTNRVLLALAFLLLFVGGFYYWSQSRQPDSVSEQSKTQADSSQADKKQLVEQIDDLRSQLTVAKEENVSLANYLDGLNDLLSKAYDQINTLESARIDRLYTIRTVNNDVIVRDQFRDSLFNQQAFMSEKINQLSEFERQNSELQRSLKHWNAKLQTMVSASAVTGDEFRVSLLKSNKKVTAKAKKVDVLDISFSVPAERHLEGTKDVYLSLVHESGKSSASSRPIATIVLPSGKLMIPVDAVQKVTFSGTKQQINFRFHPAVALKPGRYQASTYTDEGYLGSVAVELRDSFWFF